TSTLIFARILFLLCQSTLLFSLNFLVTSCAIALRVSSPITSLAVSCEANPSYKPLASEFSPNSSSSFSALFKDLATFTSSSLSIEELHECCCTTDLLLAVLFHI